MDISKQNIFNMNYTSVLEQETVKRKWTSKIVEFIKKNKFASIVAVVFFTCVGLNLFLIFSFMRVLGAM